MRSAFRDFPAVHRLLGDPNVAAFTQMLTFSGDKLLGGPQAGVIVGSAAAIARLRANPLLRALRVDRATLAALAATLRLRTIPGGITRIPLYALLAASVEALRTRAEAVRASLGAAWHARVIETSGSVGGGMLLQVPVPSAGLAVAAAAGDPAALAERLRPALVGRARDRELILDLRSVPAANDQRLRALLASELGAVA